ncbi:uncharacterized protein LOC113505421 isoform X2 [Trichoplusia ni]|nr:uncharacterized protein LOC113505421 isoform X2 [Trichoplusia ni]
MPNGEVKFFKDTTQKSSPCRLPIEIRIGRDFTHDCPVNTSQLSNDLNATISPYLYADGDLVQIPVYPMKSNGYSVQKGTWLSSKFRRYFIIDNYLATTSNITKTVYLRTLLIKIR